MTDFPWTDLEERNLNAQLGIGMIVGDTNRMVIACTKIHERTPNDSLAHWIAICAKDGELHPYVVWDVFAGRSGFSAYTGDYSFTLSEAIKDYKRRGGK